jgi:hypothetical protein
LGSYLHANKTGSNYYSDHCSGNNCAEHDFTVIAVASLPVEITEAGYATFFAPVAVKVPTGVTAYTVKINGEWATLKEIKGGVIPANTGVVLQGAKGIYKFAITTTDATVENNDLSGSVAAKYITENAYVLGYINVAEVGQPEKKEVGFYKAAMNQLEDTAFLNNANKAYLPVDNLPSSAQNAKALKFDFNTTAVENVKIETEGKKVIYDLSGRRVNDMTAPGLYIVNGKKVMVK